MLTAHHIYKSYNLNTILEDVSFNINQGQRVGLIGPNGCGKTTLLRILAGKESSDRGHVAFTPSHLRVGYLPQSLAIDPRLSLGQVLRSIQGDPQEIEASVARLAEDLALDPARNDLQAAYDLALQRLRDLDRGLYGANAAVQSTLGLDEIEENLPVGKLSGGQKTRLSLAMVLTGKPQLLLLDEPTNHLDIAMLEWLERWLADYPGAAMIVSHDRTFLDRTVTRILDMSLQTHKIREYTGNYSDYLDQYLAEREREMAAYKDQVYEIRRMRQDIQRTKQQAAWVEQTTTSREPIVRRYAKKVARKAKSREKKLDRYLASDERLEKPRQSWQMKLVFGDSPGEGYSAHQLGQDAFTLQDLSVGYAIQQPLLEGLNIRVQSKQRIALSGPNGCGKTTLLRTIAGQLPTLAGSVRLGASVKLGYMTQEQELLDPELNALESVRRLVPLNETDARSFLHYFLFSGDDALRPVGQLSYGERARLRLAMLVAEGNNLLLLDEPINHLDIPSREMFEQALTKFEGTVLAVVHDRYFISRYATDLWEVERKGLRREVLVV
ncbi:MAG: ABC-F family ATP-binding cassette domain-containing protein [Chloroflexota bacterium]|nr:ABC-F family ATP-binding cassette domain-containing protein [Chloroflexota bacterium]